MDRNLPGVEGSKFVQELRSIGINTPVIYLSAKDSDLDILEGFNSGGDDYITKPFNLEVLKARVKAVINRTKKRADIIKAKDILYSSSKKEFSINNKKLDLTKLEHDLLLEFIKNQGILLSRDYLIDSVWGGDIDVKNKTVNIAINRLKAKLKKEYIKSVRSQGYIFE